MFSDYTEKFYKMLYIPEDELFKGSKYERIKQLRIIIVGTSGIGKTTLCENIILKVQSWYGINNVNAVYTNEISLGEFLGIAFRGLEGKGWNTEKPIQIAIFDDMTSIKVPYKDQRKFFSIRHIVARDTGLNEGVVYSIYSTHDFFRLDPTIRRDALFSVFLSVPPLDQYSRREYKKFLGKKGVDELHRNVLRAIKYNHYKGKGLVVLPVNLNPDIEFGNVGYIHWNKLKDVRYWRIRSREEGDTTVDLSKMIIEYHRKKKEITKEEAIRKLEKLREANRLRQRKWYTRQKERMRKSLDN